MAMRYTNVAADSRNDGERRTVYGGAAERAVTF
jgi:hypothetical protein